MLVVGVGSMLLPEVASAQSGVVRNAPASNAEPLASSFGSAWRPLGPNGVKSLSYGLLSGRVLSLASDANDSTGNTMYVGLAGGGVWKSTNAADTVDAVRFAPLTDNLPVFSASSGFAPSLFIGALSVQPAIHPILLAGTGDPNDATDSYYGQGILRSTDGGVTWKIVRSSTDLPNANASFTGLSVSDFAWSSSAPSVVVAAFTTSPQSTAVEAALSFSVPGLYYSNDAGATWHMGTVYDGANVVQQSQPLGVQSGNAATSVVWNAKRRIFVAALRSHGYYSSADGITWKRMESQPGTGITLSNCPTITNSASCPVYRSALAVQPDTGDTYAWTIDAAAVNAGLWQDQCALTSSGACMNAGLQFNARLDHGALDTSGGRVAGGLSALSLLAIPDTSSGTRLFAGATDLFRCSLAYGSTSCTFRNATNALNGCAAAAAVAPGQHAMAGSSVANGSTNLFFGNEGGLWRSSDGVDESGPACNASDADHFENLNPALSAAGSAAQVVGLAQDPTDASVLLAGLGSNGTAATSESTNVEAWSQLSQGEGGFPHVDQSAPNNWYATIGSGVNLKQCTGGKACDSTDFAMPATVGAAQTDSDVSLNHAPSLLDPAQTDNVVLGTCRVWRGPTGDGSRWSDSNAISAPFAGSAPCTAASPLIRSLGAGGPAVQSADAQHNGSSVIYAGVAGLLDGGGVLGGHVFVSKAADSATSKTHWVDISAGAVTNNTSYGSRFNPSGFSVSAVYVDPHDATGGTVYATILGFAGPHLYRSTDFGGHWLDLSSNLPAVPANDVVVDPNDANTVYVALDSGVFATTNINSCAANDCWAVFGTGLPTTPVTQLRAGSALPTGDGRTGMLRAATYGRGLWQLPLLNAISIAAPALSSSTDNLTFSAQQVGTQSTAQNITLTSTGNAPVTIASLAVPAGFAETDSCAGKTLAVGDQCTVQVRFAPTIVGGASGMLTVYANVAGGQITVAVSGVGMSPASIVLTPGALVFPATTVNQSAPTQNITVANTGGNEAALESVTITGDFHVVTNTCGTSLKVQTSCTLSIQFTPTSSGTRTGLLTVTDDVGTQTASLSGTGNSPATDTLDVSSLSFAPQAAGTASASQTAILTNAGDVPVIIRSVTTTGDFSVINNCGASLPGHTACSILVTFVPTDVGSRAGSLTIADEFRSQTVALSGIGVAPAGVSLSPASLTFGGIGVGLSAQPQTVTLTNNGGLPLTITRQSLSGDFAMAANNCGTTLAVKNACTMTIVFTPSAAGPRTGLLTFVDNAPSGTQTVVLLGSGIDFSFAASSSATQTVTSGMSATYALSLNAVNGVSGNVAFSCSGAPAHSQCNVNPSTVSLGANSTLAVTVQTGLSSAWLEKPKLPWLGERETFAALAATFLPLCFFARRRRTYLVFALAFVLLSTAGCGTPRTIPGSGGNLTPATPTPAGTYTLTVTGSAAGISHSVPLTLVVQ